MNVWRYTAVDLENRAQRSGELAAPSAADVRAALRRIGLQVIDLRPLRRSPPDLLAQVFAAPSIRSVRDAGLRHLRARRRPLRAELYDSLATMLASGLPLLEAVETVGDSSSRQRRQRRMLIELREDLRGGSSLGAAMRDHAGWFDAVEIAMIEAGQHGGNLAEVLRSLADRHERADQLSGKLAAALAYPLIVALVGLGVTIFLSVRTLPQLVGILEQAKIEPPQLTMVIMTGGRLVADHWLLTGAAALALPVLLLLTPVTLRRLGLRMPSRVRRLVPPVLRRAAVANVSIRLAALLRTGVPLVEALHVVAPTASGGSGGPGGAVGSGGPGGSGGSLRGQLERAAAHLERGDDLAAAFDDDLWFDSEYRRLLAIGQQSGELEAILERLGERDQRRARRQIDRLAALLEPAVILTLAFFVGLVVMAAVLPLLRLQEVI